ncbi:MAG: Rpp14/Pop5 family protein [Candidatus Micrarchaeia archaeon]
MMKEKRKYLLVESSASLAAIPNFEYRLQKELLVIIGQPLFFKVNPNLHSILGEHMFIISATTEYFDYLIQGISMINRINDTSIRFHTLKISGTAKPLKNFAEKEQGLVQNKNTY